MDPSKKNTYIIAAVAFVAILLGIFFLFIFKRGPSALKKEDTTGDVKQLTEIELAKRPYVTLTPTPEGAEINISIENMSSFDRIEYELIYQADNPTIAGEKIQRGAAGSDVNTKDQKYKKSVLLGTASRGVRSPDRGIVDAKLVLHCFKGDTEYQSESRWYLEQIGTSPVTLKEDSGNVQIDIPAFGKSYWAVLADTVGVPPKYSFEPKNVLTPIYGVFSVAPELTKSAPLTIKLNGSASSAELYAYSRQNDSYKKLTSKLSGSSITADVTGLDTFVVVTSK